MQNWIKLIGGLVVIAGFIFLIKNLRQEVEPLQKIAKEIDRQGLESDALFYSESPTAVEAAYQLQQRINEEKRSKEISNTVHKEIHH